jgi:hypothetical protein
MEKLRGMKDKIISLRYYIFLGDSGEFSWNKLFYCNFIA